MIENRPGGGGVVAAQVVRQSPPDGYTILQADAAAFAINVTLIPDLPYDPVNDFTPIMQTWSFPSVLVVPASLPVKSGSDLFALAKTKPGGLNYASSGVGSGGHLLGTMLTNALGVSMTHAPYKGAGQAMPDVAAGRVDFIYASLGSVKQYLEAGSVRVLAVTSKERLKELPDVPTMTELGYPSVFLDIWFGLVAPPRTPPEIVNTIHARVEQRDARSGGGEAAGRPRALRHHQHARGIPRDDQERHRPPRPDREGRQHQAGVGSRAKGTPAACSARNVVMHDRRRDGHVVRNVGDDGLSLR